MPSSTRVKNYITPSGLQRLKDEHRFLLTRERPAVVEVVAWAASNGDRSENADYQYGKRRLRQINGRIRFLTKRIEAAEVVARKPPFDACCRPCAPAREGCASGDDVSRHTASRRGSRCSGRVPCRSRPEAINPEP